MSLSAIKRLLKCPLIRGPLLKVIKYKYIVFGQKEVFFNSEYILSEALLYNVHYSGHVN